MKVTLSQVQDIVAEAVDLNKCRTRVGRMRSLSIGFGRRVYHGKQHLEDTFYGEWEFGCFHGGWRVSSSQGEILVAGGDTVDDLREIDARLDGLPQFSFQGLQQHSRWDIDVHLSGGLVIQFLAISSDNQDEMFHIFAPNSCVISYSVADGWEVEDS